MKDGKVGFDLPKDMAAQMGITNLVDGFVSIDDLSSDQVEKLQKLQEQNEKLSTKDIARQQLNATTQIMSVVTAIYLRGQNDLRTSGIGVKTKEKIQAGSDFLYDTFDASKMSMNQIKNLATDQAMDAIKASAQPYLDKFKEFAEDNGIIDAAQQGMKKTQETIDEYIPKAKELMEKGIEKGKEMYKDAKEFFGSVDIKVDINSSSTQLAGIVVDEISKNPQLKAEFVSNIVKNTKAYA
jgi:hypothetical protein